MGRDNEAPIGNKHAAVAWPQMEKSSSTIIAGDNSTFASPSTEVVTTNTREQNDGLASLGLSQLEIEEQQAALRKIQTQKRREEQRRITAALRNRRGKPTSPPPPSPTPPFFASQHFQDKMSQEDFNVKAQSPCDGDSLSTHNKVLLRDDASIIREQLRILQDIEEKHRQHRATKSSASSESSSSLSDYKPRVQPFYSKDCGEEQEAIPSDEAIAREQQLLFDELQVSSAPKPPSSSISAPVLPVSRVPPPPAKKPTRIASSPVNTSHRNNIYQDSTLQLENGTKVRVKGTSHVYNSILAGKRTVFTECVTCGTVSQVNGNGSSGLFYCTICQQVGPVQEMASCQQDADLAAALQNQEREAAYQQKISSRSNKTKRSKPRSNK